MPSLLAWLLPCVLATSTCSIDASPFDRLLDWLEEAITDTQLGNVSLKDSFELQQGSYGNSLISKRRFQQDDIVLVLPLSRLVSKRNYSFHLNGLRPHAQAASYLALQKGLGESSALKPVIDLMPASQSHLPRYWKSDFLEKYFNGSSFPKLLQRTSAEMQEAYKHVQSSYASAISWSDFQWGWDTWATRTFIEKDKMPSMYPLLDLCQHDDSPNLHIAFNSDSNQVIATASRTIDIGQELTTSYWSGKGNAWQALETWGFLTPNTSMTAGIQVSPEEASEAQEKVLGMRHEHQAHFTLSLQKNTSDSAANVFIGFLRLLAAGNRLETKSANDHIRTYLRWSADFSTLEANALHIGQLLVGMALAKYSAPADVEEAKDEHLQFGVQLHLGERAILGWWLQALRASPRKGKGKTK